MKKEWLKLKKTPSKLPEMKSSHLIKNSLDGSKADN